MIVQSQLSLGCYKHRMAAGFIAQRPSHRHFLGSIRSGVLCGPIPLSKSSAMNNNCERRIKQMPARVQLLILSDDSKETVFFVGDASGKEDAVAQREKIPQAIELKRRAIGAH